MATQNVKILIRRGLREQLASDVLDTGEFGFTTDTNQLFIGIDPAINEVQFDPFINAHAIIQSWLDSDDCPFENLRVDEDLVIRNIPTAFDEDGTPISGVQSLIDAMHFFTQTINLVGDFNVNAGDTIYQRKFIYADDETNISELTPGKTYQIREIKNNTNDFFNNASGTIGKTFSAYDHFTVRHDYDIVPNPNPHNNARVIEVVDIQKITEGIVGYSEYNSFNNRKQIEVRVREGYQEFIPDNPYIIDNYYHFNGNSIDNSLDSDFGLFQWKITLNYDTISLKVLRLQTDGTNDWEDVSFSILQDEPGTGNVDALTETGHAYPLDSYGDDYDYALVTTGTELNFYQKVAGVWVLLSSRTIVTGELTISDDKPVDAELGDFWATLSYDKKWVKQDVSIIDDSGDYSGSIETVNFNGIDIDKPLVTLMNDTTLFDHVVVTKSSKITYWKRDNEIADWKLLGSDKQEEGLVSMNINSAVHDLPMNLVNRYEKNPTGHWKVILTENKGTAEETVRELENTEFWFWYYPDVIPGYNGEPLVAGQVYIPGTEGDAEEDEIKIIYYYHGDFQFSVKPPVTFEVQNQPQVDKLDKRTDGYTLLDGDYYVYTDRDIYGGTNLNIFQWNSESVNYQHDTVPVYYSDELATANTKDNILLYALPYKFENNTELNVGILELRKRDYETSKMWYPFDHTRDTLSYYFSLNPIPKLTDFDFTYAYSVLGRSEFTVGYLGRARRNVEVITENSFNQLFADQHLSAQDAYTGIRPSLFRKVFEDTDGVFLRYNKNINSTFFVDYSLKQVTETKTFLRVGQLKIINGYPHGIPEIKLTDENTEIWHDNVILVEDDPNTTGNEEVTMGNGDKIEDLDEFSNIVFETAVGEDAYDNETNDLLIIYKQDPNCKTEVSYTIKRWTM